MHETKTVLFQESWQSVSTASCGLAAMTQENNLSSLWVLGSIMFHPCWVTCISQVRCKNYPRLSSLAPQHVEASLERAAGAGCTWHSVLIPLPCWQGCPHPRLSAHWPRWKPDPIPSEGASLPFPSWQPKWFSPDPTSTGQRREWAGQTSCCICVPRAEKGSVPYSDSCSSLCLWVHANKGSNC